MATTATTLNPALFEPANEIAEDDDFLDDAGLNAESHLSSGQGTQWQLNGRRIQEESVQMNPVEQVVAE